MEFGPLTISSFQQQKMMAVLETFETQQSRQSDLNGRAGGQISATHHPSHAFSVVIHDAGQMIRDGAIATARHRITVGGGGRLGEIQPALIENLDLGLGKSHSQGLGGTSPATLGGRRQRPLATGSGVSGASVRSEVMQSAKLRATTATRVEPPLIGQAVERRFVIERALGLQDLRVPVEAQPRKITPHRVCVFGPTAIGIQIFQAQAQAPTETADIEPTQKGRQQGARMRKTGRRRGESPRLDSR